MPSRCRARGQRLAAAFQARGATDPEIEQAGRLGLVPAPEVASVEQGLDSGFPPRPEIRAGEFLVSRVQDYQRGFRRGRGCEAGGTQFVFRVVRILDRYVRAPS